MFRLKAPKNVYRKKLMSILPAFKEQTLLFSKKHYLSALYNKNDSHFPNEKVFYVLKIQVI